ncbi:MAG: Response regulator, partial [uncultured Rubrobacteraceae bacterium]
GQDNTVGRGQPGRRGSDPPGPEEEQHRQRSGRRPRRGGGPRLPLRYGALRGAGLERHAAGGVAGPQAAEGGWAGGPAADAGRRADQALACGDPHLLQGATGPRGRLRLRGEQLHPQTGRLRPVRRGGPATRSLLAGPERDAEDERL